MYKRNQSDMLVNVEGLCLISLLLLVGQVIGENDKRLLLHTSDDLLQELQTLKTKVQTLETKVPQLEASVTSLQSVKGAGGGSTYVRWGNHDCPHNGTTLVYSGYTAGSYYDHIGGAANNLCLPPDPQWDHYDDTVATNNQIYGAEYNVGWNNGNMGTEFFGKSIQNDDVPCAVCYSQRSEMIMIPARLDCYPGWTKEYSGYLMSGHYVNKSPSMYTCVDKAVETVVGGHRDQNGRLLFLVEGICGSLECPPYVNGRELTCVVCTK
ncbi:hypothetical protein ACF0H5_002953 [Mactra antiquata]